MLAPPRKLNRRRPLLAGVAVLGLSFGWSDAGGGGGETKPHQPEQQHGEATPGGEFPKEVSFGSDTLRSVYGNHFLFGVAANNSQLDGRNAKAAEIISRHFSSLTAENAMKWQSLQPTPGTYDFTAADRCVEFGQTHGLAVVGHTLVWHSQTPAWVFEGEDGGVATREELLARMRDHIHTVAGRYRGRIHGWDVVNEAISDGPGGLRDSPWRRIIGDDYLDHAFRLAKEAAPEAELYYNDYGLADPGKRARTVAMLRGLIERGVPIDGVGMQGHYRLRWPSLANVEASIQAFSDLGLQVMITELDIDVLPSRGNVGVADISRREEADPQLNPYREGLPDDIQEQLAERYGELFTLFVRYRHEITRVTLWGLDDGQSWLNQFPIRGRTNHPLLFDRDLEPKLAFFEVGRAGRASR
jgi:endo-1,4-beta-xylanase